MTDEVMNLRGPSKAYGFITSLNGALVTLPQGTSVLPWGG
ncbi:hypothetical protein ACVW1C_005771 [Bradyrhizobium sp. USDA 4011]